MRVQQPLKQFFVTFSKIKDLQEDEGDRKQNLDWDFTVIFVQDLDEAHRFLFNLAVMFFDVHSREPIIKFVNFVAVLLSEHLKTLIINYEIKEDFCLPKFEKNEKKTIIIIIPLLRRGYLGMIIILRITQNKSGSRNFLQL